MSRPKYLRIKISFSKCNKAKGTQCVSISLPLNPFSSLSFELESSSLSKTSYVNFSIKKEYINTRKSNVSSQTYVFNHTLQSIYLIITSIIKVIPSAFIISSLIIQAYTSFKNEKRAHLLILVPCQKNL